MIKYKRFISMIISLALLTMGTTTYAFDYNTNTNNNIVDFIAKNGTTYHYQNSEQDQNQDEYQDPFAANNSIWQQLNNTRQSFHTELIQDHTSIQTPSVNNNNGHFLEVINGQISLDKLKDLVKVNGNTNAGDALLTGTPSSWNNGGSDAYNDFITSSNVDLNDIFKKLDDGSYKNIEGDYPGSYYTKDRYVISLKKALQNAGASSDIQNNAETAARDWRVNDGGQSISLIDPSFMFNNWAVNNGFDTSNPIFSFPWGCISINGFPYKYDNDNNLFDFKNFIKTDDNNNINYRFDIHDLINEYGGIKKTVPINGLTNDIYDITNPITRYKLIKDYYKYFDNFGFDKVNVSTVTQYKINAVDVGRIEHKEPLTSPVNNMLPYKWTWTNRNSNAQGSGQTFTAANNCAIKFNVPGDYDVVCEQLHSVTRANVISVQKSEFTVLTDTGYIIDAPNNLISSSEETIDEHTSNEYICTTNENRWTVHVGQAQAGHTIQFGDSINNYYSERIK